MITRLNVENFRCIPRGELELRRMTVLTGPNSTGKSSVLYGLLALRNVVLDSNQDLDVFFNLGFLNLGGFSENVHLKDTNSNIGLGIEVATETVRCGYEASLGKKASLLRLESSGPFNVKLKLKVTFPYPANSTATSEVKGDFGTAHIKWNGITPAITMLSSGLPPGGEAGHRAGYEDRMRVMDELSRSLTAPIEELRVTDFIAVKRGFTKPFYSTVPVQPQLRTEEELATIIAIDRDLEGKVAHYLERIVNRSFAARAIVGLGSFHLQTRDPSTGFVSDLVNEGFGTNQLVTILTKCLRKETRTICIEEPEIHLNPDLIDRLLRVLIEIAEKEDKAFVITSHSEHVVVSLLNAVARKRLSADDAAIYYLSKEGDAAKIERQEVNDKGQIEGGLKAFYETELKETREFFDIVAEQ